MLIDRQTLNDLEIARPDWHGPDLLGLMDHTRSDGGRARLRTMLLTPLGDRDGILERQRTLRALSGVVASFDLRELGHVIAMVTQYLASNYAELPRGRLASLYVDLRYPGIVDRIVGDLEAVAALLKIAEQFRRTLDTVGATAPEVALLATELGALIDTPVLRRLEAATRKGGRRRRRLARLDEPIRREGRKPLAELVRLLHELDALQSLARAAATPGFVYPDIVDAPVPVFIAEAAFHPLLQHPRPTDFDMNGGARLVFLTGPNMAGKTTYLRTCGIIALLAHVGMPVPARRATISVIDVLFTVLGTQDSVTRGESFFLAEVRRVGELTRHLAAGKRVLCLADEMFKGTNVLDAFDATRLVVASLARYRDGLFIVSSHLTELAHDLDSEPAVALRKFDAFMSDGVPRFSYELQHGVSSQRLGMVLLEREGVSGALAAIGRGRPA